MLRNFYYRIYNINYIIISGCGLILGKKDLRRGNGSGSGPGGELMCVMSVGLLAGVGGRLLMHVRLGLEYERGGRLARLVCRAGRLLGRPGRHGYVAQRLHEQIRVLQLV